MTTKGIFRTKGGQFTLWSAKKHRRKLREPGSFISRGGKKIVIRPRSQPQGQEPPEGNGSTEQLLLNLYPRPRIQQPDSQPDTYYFSQSTGKFPGRAKKPSPTEWHNPNPRYRNLRESYNFLMAYYKSLDN